MAHPLHSNQHAARILRDEIRRLHRDLWSAILDDLNERGMLESGHHEVLRGEIEEQNVALEQLVEIAEEEARATQSSMPLTNFDHVILRQWIARRERLRLVGALRTELARHSVGRDLVR